MSLSQNDRAFLAELCGVLLHKLCPKDDYPKAYAQVQSALDRAEEREQKAVEEMYKTPPKTEEKAP